MFDDRVRPSPKLDRQRLALGAQPPRVITHVLRPPLPAKEALRLQSVDGVADGSGGEIELPGELAYRLSSTSW